MRPMAVTLQDLADAAGEHLVALEGDGSVQPSGAAYDSRAVSGGDLFFCIPGESFDGHLYAADAVAAGASALCVEHRLDLGVPEMIVDSVRGVMPDLSARVYGHPARDLTLMGVTGTNGKTTSAFLLESILRADGRKTGLIGTIETRVGDERQPGVRTTPESVDVQRLFARMRDAEVTSVAMEVTSHALVLGRVDGVVYDCAIFTNLTQDHLDFHGDMDSYFESKASLFTPERATVAAINIDDPYGRLLAARTSLPTLTYGGSDEADVHATDVRFGPLGSRFVARSPEGEIEVATSLVGPFNVMNCLGAIAGCLQIGIPLETTARGIGDLASVPGRFESIDLGQSFTVVVDYAHTPDSLDNVLQAAGRVAGAQGGRVIAVFGCGGDRDRGKRPLMGIAAARGADVVIVTSDNPRSEDPQSIISEIVEGVIAEKPEGPDAALVDRREAIQLALTSAGDGDVVVVAGKGHETGQEFSDVTLPFDDRDVVRELLGELRADAR